MPQVVEAYVQQPGSLEQGLERTTRKVAGVDKGPDRRGEYEPVVLPQSGELSGLFELAIVMTFESVYSPGGGEIGAPGLVEVNGKPALQNLRCIAARLLHRSPEGI